MGGMTWEVLEDSDSQAKSKLAARTYSHKPGDLEYKQIERERERKKLFPLFLPLLFFLPLPPLHTHTLLHNERGKHRSKPFYPHAFMSHLPKVPSHSGQRNPSGFPYSSCCPWPSLHSLLSKRIPAIAK